MTPQQKQIIKQATAKVRKLFTENPAPAHGFDHAHRVAQNAVEIATAEKANVFLCELAAILHDVGRVPEHKLKLTKKDVHNTHHELSYSMCRDWFRHDRIFLGLSDQEKKILLYSIRYHWNNAATLYKEAIVLRDADKLDALGTIGVRRAQLFFKNDTKRLNRDCRFKYDMYYWLITDKARQIVESRKLMKPINKFYWDRLAKQIKPIVV